MQQRMGTELIGADVLSVHTGHKIGVVSGALVQNKNLKIELLEVLVANTKQYHYLITSDIRAYDGHKIIINSQQDLSGADELVRYQGLIESANRLIGSAVITQSGQKLGKIKDFSIDTIHFIITKIHVPGRFWQRILHERLIIDSSDIVDIKEKKIIVRDATIKSRAGSKVLPAKV